MTNLDLIWHSAGPWDTSGYGQQTALVVQHLQRAGVDVEFSCPPQTDEEYGGSIHCWNSPTLSGDELTNNVRVAFNGEPGRAVAFIDFLRISKGRTEDVDLLYWFPFNFDPPPPSAIRYLKTRQPRVAAMSRWAQRALARSGIEASYIPCGVDLDVFRPPTDATRSAMRADLGLDDDAFVAGMVAVNNEWESNRKSFPEAMMAFADLRREHSDAFLYLHTDLTGNQLNGLRIPDLADSLDLPNGSVLATSPEQHSAGIAGADMGKLYGMFDVLLAPSAGEGFGLPVIEAQACGVPAIVSGFTSQPELVGSGWIVPGQRRWAHHAASWLLSPDVPSIVDALKAAYDNRCGSREQAIKHASKYDIRRVTSEAWLPELERWFEP